jgi:drug/metabolite transporter (DMT)-like permease
MGAGSAVGHLMLLKAYEKAEPATITPFLYSQIPCALLAGWLVYGHIPDQWAVLGMLVIALCGAASAWLSIRERSSAPESGRPAALKTIATTACIH